MFCGQCGTKISGDTKFCSGCGNPMDAPSVAAPVHSNEAVDTSVQILLKRAAMALEDGDFQKVGQLTEQVLSQNPENAGAYVLQLLVKFNLTSEEMLAECEGQWQDSPLFQRALRFADAGYKKTLTDYAETGKKNKLLKEARKKLSATLNPAAAEDLLTVFAGDKAVNELLSLCADRREKIADAYMDQLLQNHNLSDADELAECCDDWYGSPVYAQFVRFATEERKQKIKQYEKSASKHKGEIGEKHGILTRAKTLSAETKGIEGALALLEPIAGYAPADEYATELKKRQSDLYAAAVQMSEKKDCVNAEKTFTELGGYKDSRERAEYEKQASAESEQRRAIAHKKMKKRLLFATSAVAFITVCAAVILIITGGPPSSRSVLARTERWLTQEAGFNQTDKTSLNQRVSNGDEVLFLVDFIASDGYKRVTGVMTWSFAAEGRAPGRHNGVTPYMEIHTAVPIVSMDTAVAAIILTATANFGTHAPAAVLANADYRMTYENLPEGRTDMHVSGVYNAGNAIAEYAFTAAFVYDTNGWRVQGIPAPSLDFKMTTAIDASDAYNAMVTQPITFGVVTVQPGAYELDPVSLTYSDYYTIAAATAHFSTTTPSINVKGTMHAVFSHNNGRWSYTSSEVNITEYSQLPGAELTSVAALQQMHAHDITFYNVKFDAGTLDMPNAASVEYSGYYMEATATTGFTARGGLFTLGGTLQGHFTRTEAGWILLRAEVMEGLFTPLVSLTAADVQSVVDSFALTYDGHRLTGTRAVTRFDVGEMGVDMNTLVTVEFEVEHGIKTVRYRTNFTFYFNPLEGYLNRSNTGAVFISSRLTTNNFIRTFSARYTLALSGATPTNITNTGDATITVEIANANRAIVTVRYPSGSARFEGVFNPDTGVISNFSDAPVRDINVSYRIIFALTGNIRYTPRLFINDINWLDGTINGSISFTTPAIGVDNFSMFFS